MTLLSDYALYVIKAPWPEMEFEITQRLLSTPFLCESLLDYIDKFKRRVYAVEAVFKDALLSD